MHVLHALKVMLVLIHQQILYNAQRATMPLAMQQYVSDALEGILVMTPLYHLCNVWQVIMHLRGAQYAISALQEQLVPAMVPLQQLYANQDITQQHQEVLTVHYAPRVMSVLSPISHRLHVLKEPTLWLATQHVFFVLRATAVHLLILIL